MASLRQIRANQANSRKSTGARTPEGRKASAANGTSHGLSATTCLRADEERLVDARLAELETELKPQGPTQRALVREIAAASVRIARCDREEQARRQHRERRAAAHWDDDRRAEAAELARSLPHEPALTLRKLRQTLHGAQWLRQAWAELGAHSRPLDDQGRQRAFDLLGLSLDRRQGATPLDLPAGSDHAARGAALAAHQAALITTQIAELDRRTSERFVAIDQANRLEAARGNVPVSDPMRRLFRRYRAEAVAQRDRALAEFWNHRARD
jgi:hypothetical protein